MREAAHLARAYGISLHTYQVENDNDVAYSREKSGMMPAEYAESLGWISADVWHAHCVKLDAPGIALFAHTGTSVAHCPCSNMRLASSIAPIPTMRRTGVSVGLGVDGSASNDAGHLLGKTRQAMSLARVGIGPGAGARRYRRAGPRHERRPCRFSSRYSGASRGGCARPRCRADLLHAATGSAFHHQRQAGRCRRTTVADRTARVGRQAQPAGAATGGLGQAKRRTIGTSGIAERA